MERQQELFQDVEPAKAARQLTVTAPVGRTLSKTQKTFNRLIRRVETLRSQIRKTTAHLEEVLRVYERDLRPRLDVVSVLRRQLARALAPFLTDPRLRRASDRDLLRTIVTNLIDDAASHEGGIVDQDLEALYESLTEPADAAEAEEQRGEFEAMRSEVESLFGVMGLEVDLSELGPDATEEELRARLEQAMDDAREQENSVKSPKSRRRRPTKKQLESEERQRQTEEARKRTIGAIYKQLAKALHPDLEGDPQRRSEKLVLMQELTAAYRHHDLHTMLRLELEWLHREEGDLDRLSEEKLGIYNAVLREQVSELEREHEMIGLHPRFQPLVAEDGLFGFHLDLNIAARAAQLETVIVSMRGDLERLDGPGGLKEVRDLLKAVRALHREDRSRLF